jgi:FkbM family methyltransferase
MALGATVIEWINGARLIVRNGDTGLTLNIYTGLQEFADMGYLLHVLRPSDHFADIGANLGSYTVLAGAVVGASGVAVEPVPHTFARLVDNIRLNDISRLITPLNIGLADTAGTMTFTRDLDTVNHVVAPGETSGSTIDVNVMPLDMAIGSTVPNVIKIDVEGYEMRVIEGATQTFGNESLHSVIMELNGSGNRYGVDDSIILRRMLDFGFNTYRYDPLTRDLRSLQGEKEKSGNTLFVRNEMLVKERLRTAPSFNILGTVI